MAERTIGEVAQQAGMQASALRYYESVGLLPAPKRVNGRRRYDESVLQQLTIIQMAQRAGFTIAEIQTLRHGFEPDTPPSARWRQLAAEKLVELHGRLRQTQQMIQVLENGLQCGCLQFEDCVILEDARCEVGNE
jgi:MerR family redox-sensitive transcriptional activator SoxR